MLVERQPSAARGFRRSTGYTLVEVIVALGIISVLILGVFVPILDTSRDVARRIQCQHKMRELGFGVLNLESAKRVYPSGGTHPWPRINHYVNDTALAPIPFGPEKQGLGWMYQVLPYLPNHSAPQPSHEAGLNEFSTNLFFCPARRGQTRSIDEPRRLLNDYVGLVAPPSRTDLGNERYEELLDGDQGCKSAYGFWGSRIPGNAYMPRSRDSLGRNFVPFLGVIVRGSHYVTQEGRVVDLQYGEQVTMRRIRDGLSRTGMITEKHVPRSGYPAGDTLGWSDGWGFDTLRYSMCTPVLDSSANSYTDEWSAGSNHPGGVQVVMADGSVKVVSYDVDVETWHRMGHRSDVYPINIDKLNGTVER